MEHRVEEDNIIIHLGQSLITQNQETRVQILNLLIENKRYLSTSNSRSLIPGIIACLQDQKENIRNLSELILAQTLILLGGNAFIPYLQTLNPVLVQNLKPVFQKYTPQPLFQSSIPLINERTEMKNPNTHPFEFTVNRQNSKGSIVREETYLLKTEDIKIIATGTKQKRLESDTKIKFSVQQLRQDSIDRLKDQMKQCYSPDLYKLLFNPDFKKQIQATLLIQYLFNQNFQEAVKILDLNFKWIWIKLQETSNTQLVKSILELSSHLVSILSQNSYTLLEGEACLFLPILCEKIGNNSSIIRGTIKKIIHSTTGIYPPEKVAFFLVNALNSKNFRTKAQCLEEIQSLVSEFGNGILSQKDIKIIAWMIDSADSSIRQAAVGVVGEIYKEIQDSIWGLIGEVSSKAKGMIEQRFKSIGNLLSNSSPVKEDLVVYQTYNSFQKFQRKYSEGIQSSGVEQSKKKPQNQFQSKKSIYNNVPVKADQKFIQKTRNNSRDFKISPYQRSKANQEQLQTENNMAQLDDLLDYPQYASDESLLLDSLNVEEPDSEVDKIIYTLKSGDMASKVDSLVALNQIIQNKLQTHLLQLKEKANQIVDKLTQVLVTTFQKIPLEFPMRFSKYCLNVIHKVASTQTIMRCVDQKTLFILTENLLNKLLVQNLDKIGGKVQAEALLRTLNGAMLKVLENAHPHRILMILIEMLQKYKSPELNSKVHGLAIKCLLKLLKIFDVIIDDIQIDKFLLVIHQYLCSDTEMGNFSSEEQGKSAMQKIVKQLVQIKGQKIWDYLDLVKRHKVKDQYIEKWISSFTPKSHKLPIQNSVLHNIFQRLSKNDTYKEAIKELFDYTQTHSKADISPFITKQNPQKHKKISQDLQKLRIKKNSQLQTPKLTDQYNFQEFHNKLDMIKKKYGLSKESPSSQATAIIASMKTKVNILLMKASGIDEQSVLISNIKGHIQTLNKIR